MNYELFMLLPQGGATVAGKQMTTGVIREQITLLTCLGLLRLLFPHYGAVILPFPVIVSRFKKI